MSAIFEDPGAASTPHSISLSFFKVLELISNRDAAAVHQAGGLRCCLNFILTGKDFVFQDALLSAMSVVVRCCRCVLAWELCKLLQWIALAPHAIPLPTAAWT